MKPKGKIEQTKRGRWRYTRPRFGFGQPEKKTFATWPEAMKYATHHIESTGGTQIEQASEETNWLASRPRWSHHEYPEERLR